MRLAIIHFTPIELYPPIQNFLCVLDKKPIAPDIVVSTTTQTIGLPTFTTKNIRIVRKTKLTRQLGSFWRYINYITFYLSCIRLLLLYRPPKVFYYDTLSSLPTYIYKRFINSKAEIFIHYHEYTSKEEYNSGMNLARLFHRLERRLYPEAESVSHTNDFRMEMFKQDIAPVIIPKANIIPNYPPSIWETTPKPIGSLPLKIIYIGALSLTTMHTEKFARWILSCNGKVTWDIYSFNYSGEAKEYILSLVSPWITLNNGVDYNTIPKILANYDVGVILYNGHIDNYVYNAPNKLFEYLACGLDVWFPKEMVGCYNYVTENHYPKVTCIDYQDLVGLNVQPLVSRDGMKYQRSSFYCEPVYEKLYEDFFAK